MDLNEFRSFISDSGFDVWTWIDMSISVACADHDHEMRNRRDGIIQRLYAARCHSCDYHFSGDSKEIEPLPKEDEEEEEDDDERKSVVEIKILLDDQNQSEECLIGLLRRLVGMCTTFKTLKETDIGRHVSRLRKHTSNEVRRLVKFLVRKWKDTVDEWVRLNAPMDDGKKSPTIDVHCEGNIVISENTSVSRRFTPPKETLKRNQVESNYKSSSAKKRTCDQNFRTTRDAKKQITPALIISQNRRIMLQFSGGKYW